MLKYTKAEVGFLPVLLQKVVLDDFGNFQRDLVTLSQGALQEIRNETSTAHLSDELHNFRQILFVLQDFASLDAEGGKLGVILVIEIIKSTHVPLQSETMDRSNHLLAVADQPVD